MSDYHIFRTAGVEVAGSPLRYVEKRGVRPWDEGTRLLAEAVAAPPGARALDLGCGSGVVGAVMARTAADVVLTDASVPAVACAERTIAANDLRNARAVLHAGVPPGEYDVIAACLPRGTELAERLIRAAGAALRPGGRLLLAGHKLGGIKTFIDRAAQIFGAARVVKIKAGFRVAVAQKTGPIAPPEGDGYVAREVLLRGEPAWLVAAPGVFAWEGLDPGTAALIEHMEIRPGERVLDLGCGSGLAGLAAARLAAARVVLVDADVRAVEAARRTLAANGVAGAEVLPSDCAQAVRGETFDVVITNPPFHHGRDVDYDVARQFIQDARSVLAGGGRLYLVANAFLRYEDHIQDVFGAVRTVFRDRRYKVLMAAAAQGDGS